MKYQSNHQNNMSNLKLPKAIDQAINQRSQFNSPRFTAEETAKLNSSKAYLLNQSKTHFKQNLSSQQLYSQQLQLPQSQQLQQQPGYTLQQQQQQNHVQQQIQNCLSTGNINNNNNNNSNQQKVFGFNQESKRGFSAKKKDTIQSQQQEYLASSIQGSVKKQIQQSQQSNQQSGSGLIDISNLQKTQMRKQQTPSMIKKQGINSLVDVNVNQITPSLSHTPVANQNISLSRKATHRKSQSQAFNSSTSPSGGLWNQNYQLAPFQKNKDQSSSEYATEADKSASKSNVIGDKTSNQLSKISNLSTSIPQLPLTLSGLPQTSPSNFNNEPMQKISSVYQPTSPYFNQQGLPLQPNYQNSPSHNYQNFQQNYQSYQHGNGIAMQTEQQKSVRQTPKNSLYIDQNQIPKSNGVDLVYHPLSAKNNSGKKTFRSNLIATNVQVKQRGNRSSSGHINLNLKSQNQKGEILLQKKIELINSERITAGKSYSFSQGQLQHVLNQPYVQQANPQTPQAQQNNIRKVNVSSLQFTQLQQSSQSTLSTKNLKEVDKNKKPVSYQELDNVKNTDSLNVPYTERFNKSKQNNQTYNFNTSTNNNNNNNNNNNLNTTSTNKDKLVKQQQQLSMLVSQQKQEQFNSDQELQFKDKNDEKETQSCESENSALNNNNSNTNNNKNYKNNNYIQGNSGQKKNQNNNSEISSNSTTPANKRNSISKQLDKKHPEIPYYISGLQNSFKTPYPMDAFSQLFRQHFLQTCQGVLYSNLARPANPRDLVTKKVQLGPRNSRFKKTLIFDMDETLIHCNENVNTPSDVIVDVKFPTGEFIQAGINVRPYAIETLQELSEEFEIIIFTASHNCYAQAVIDHLDPQKKYVHHRYYRDQCIQTPQGVYIKDLRVFTDRPLHEVVLIDNAAYSFSFQVDNGIPIIPFYDNKNDTELLHLQSYLRNLHHVSDVRAYNRQHLKMSFFNEPEGPQKVHDNLFKKNY